MGDLDITVLELEGQQVHDGRTFPLAYRCDSDEATMGEATSWMAKNASRLSSQATQHGAVFLRGFPLASAEDFDTAVQAFDLPGFSYDDSLSNAYRINYTPRVFSANEAPPEETISLHHEMAQTPIYPSKLFFFCQVAPETGGTTPICRSDILWERLVENVLPSLMTARKRVCCIPMSCPLKPTRRPAWDAVGKVLSVPTRGKTPRPAWRRWTMFGNGCLTATFAPPLPSCQPCENWVREGTVSSTS